LSNDLQWITAGLDRIEGHVLDSNGIIGGTTGTVATGAAGSSGFRILGAKEAANIGAPAPEITPVTGDDAYLGGFIFPSGNARQFLLTAAVIDLQVGQYFGAGNSQNVGNSSLGFLDVLPFSLINVALITVSQSKSQASGNVGTGIWSGFILPKVQAFPLGRETQSERAAVASRWQFVISISDRLPWGETFTTGVHGIQQANYVQWSSNNRKTFHRFNGDGGTTVFGPLKYVPASSSLLDVVVYKDNYRQTSGITINTTTKQLTFTPAPGNNSVIAVYYDHTGQQ
jgi:hypothetical protein